MSDITQFRQFTHFLYLEKQALCFNTVKVFISKSLCKIKLPPVVKFLDKHRFNKTFKNITLGIRIKFYVRYVALDHGFSDMIGALGETN